MDKETLMEYLAEAWHINGYNPEDWDDDYNRYNEVIAIGNSIWGYLSDKLDQKDKRIKELKKDITEFIELGTDQFVTERIKELEEKVLKLKKLLLLADPIVQHVEVGETQLIQWDDFIINFPDEA